MISEVISELYILLKPFILKTTKG